MEHFFVAVFFCPVSAVIAFENTYQSICVRGLFSCGVTPPEGHVDSRHLETEEDEETRDGDTGIKGGGGQVVVTGPPVIPVTSQPEHEDEAERQTVRVEVRQSWGHVRGRGQQHGPVDVLQPTDIREPLGGVPEGDGQESTDQETPLNAGVQSTILVTKDTGGSNGSPDDRGRVEGVGGTAGERVTCLGADVRLGVDEPGGGGQVDG